MSIQLSYPGVYIQELSSGVHTISGVATSIAAFVGYTARGRDNWPQHIFSFADFERTCGGLDISSELSYAVQQFFDNGGTEAYVVRIPKSDATWATVNLYSSDNTLALTSPMTALRTPTPHRST
jgi:phage tail sheath protein FI